MKQSATGDLVWALVRCESGFVNAVVHILVNEIGELGLLRFEIFWKEIDGFATRKFIKQIVKHPADVVLAVVNNLLRLPVP